jgi:uncharacterized protein (TIGR00645 family)
MVVWLCHARVGHRQGLYPKKASPSGEAFVFVAVAAAIDDRGYETFVSRLRLEGHPDQPEWLSHVNATVLKVKLAMAIIGISSIHLLATFIKARSMDGETIMWQILLHLTFVVSAVALAYIDKLTQPGGKHAGAH